MIGYLTHLASATVECNTADKSTCDTGLPAISANNANLQFVLQIVFGIASGIAVIIIIIAALQLAASQGNPQEAAKARQAIIYAAIGLILALSAEIIVTFVLNSL